MDKYLIKRPRLAADPLSSDADAETETRIDTSDTADGVRDDDSDSEGHVPRRHHLHDNPLDCHANDVGVNRDTDVVPRFQAPALPSAARASNKSNSKRKFNPKWREKHPWIRYDPVNDGMLCGVCIEFGVPDSEESKRSRGAWTTVMVRKWKKALEKVMDHERSQMHKMAKERQVASKQCRESGGVVTVAIAGQMRNRLALKEKNRTIMKKNLRTTYYLCKAKAAHFTNFQDTLELQIENGLEDLKHFLDNAPKNANYTSHQVIEEYVAAIGLYIEKNILESLRSASYYTLLLDESQDINTVEEMSVCARWVPPKEKPVERFLGILPLKRTSAEVLI
ncbi:zinc finger MYM-type protein 1-like [Lineus longissimus]|uniref:zinc finger MYM-type protein 1-like n=1 Tax=Lineus longissimus TaxID=88925 RepID=UPI00315C9BE3